MFNFFNLECVMTQSLNHHRHHEKQKGKNNLTSVAAKKYYLIFVTCLILGICCVGIVGSKVWNRIFIPKKEKIRD